MTTPGYEQEILVQLGKITSELAHLGTAVADLKGEFQRIRERQVSQSAFDALDQRVKELEGIEVEFAEFRATVKTALGLGGSGAVAGLAGIAVHFFG